MRLVKSPASPTINQLGFRDVGKSGVAFSRRVSGCLFETRFSRKSGARLSASIKASRPPLRDGAIIFGDLIVPPAAVDRSRTMPRKRQTISPLYATAAGTRLSQVLPCLTCRERSAAERALEEVAAVFVGAMHGELAPRPDGRLLRFLPRGCCRQPRVKADIEALVA
jgi:hypothetical protein